MSTGQLIFGLIFIAIGFSAFTNVDIFHYLVPILFIYVGIRILTKRNRYEKRTKQSLLSQDAFNEVAVFSASRNQVTATDFTEGKAASIFSGMELDLSKAKMKGKTADVELVAIFGGLKMRVPKNWLVVTDGTGILGGFTNHTEGGTSANKLVVRGAAIFGGVEIVN